MRSNGSTMMATWQLKQAFRWPSHANYRTVTKESDNTTTWMDTSLVEDLVLHLNANLQVWNLNLHYKSLENNLDLNLRPGQSNLFPETYIFIHVIRKYTLRRVKNHPSYLSFRPPFIPPSNCVSMSSRWLILAITSSALPPEERREPDRPLFICPPP